jgi:hypothetical protein
VRKSQTIAIEIERTLSKDEVLGLYLTLAPYGGNLEGIRAASLAYFGKEPKKLSLAEAALLVALPQSPELRRPDRLAAAARAARDRVLDRIARAGKIPADEIALAKLDPVEKLVYRSNLLGSDQRITNTGGGNTATGADALQYNTTGGDNTAVGIDSLYSNVTGAKNIALGNKAGFNLTTGSDNIALGFHAGFDITTSHNIDIGNQGMRGDVKTIRRS